MFTNPGRVVSKFQFSQLFSGAWSKGMSIGNITMGFRNTGIYPFNRSALLRKLPSSPEIFDSENEVPGDFSGNSIIADGDTDREDEVPGGFSGNPVERDTNSEDEVPGGFSGNPAERNRDSEDEVPGGFSGNPVEIDTNSEDEVPGGYSGNPTERDAAEDEVSGGFSCNPAERDTDTTDEGSRCFSRYFVIPKKKNDGECSKGFFLLFCFCFVFFPKTLS